jgi:uncharacterized NAD(P)/FAD-binding protein YdhS
MKKKSVITIVGGGANGVATFLSLVIKIISGTYQFPVKLILIEKDPDVGPGLAFGTQEEGQILNTAAHLMGIFPNEPNHFALWLQNNSSALKQEYPGIETHEQAFVPRRLYGRYLQETLDLYIKKAKEHGIEVNIVKSEALDADMHQDALRIELASGDIIESDVLVLATGTPKPNNFPHIKESPNYIDFPWPAARILDIIPRNAPVSILGTSLSAIDTLITLHEHDYTGHITLYSPNGLLPRVQTPFNVSYERKVLTLENIRKLIREKERSLRAKDLFRLFAAEAELALGEKQNWKQYNRIDAPHLDLLKEDLEVALKGESLLQNIATSTRHISFDIWKLLPPDQKVLFIKWFGPHWDINRHAMPPINARKLIKMLEKGQLTFKAHSAKVEWDADENQFIIYRNNLPADTARYLVNATGTAKNVEKMDVPILQQLLKKELIVPHPASGVKANTHTLQLLVPGHPKAALYGVGQLLTGELFDTNAVWFNVERIDPMTNHILNYLHGRTQ